MVEPETRKNSSMETTRPQREAARTARGIPTDGRRERTAFGGALEILPLETKGQKKKLRGQHCLRTR